MKQTESYIRDRVRHEMPELVDKIKEQVAEQLCSTVLAGLVNVEDGVTFNFYLNHFLVKDIKVIIGQEISAYLETSTVVKQQPAVKRQVKVQKK